jgi:hypothetical protein
LSDRADIPLHLSSPEAHAVACLVSRLSYEACQQFSRTMMPISGNPYSGRREGDIMWSAIQNIRQQLAELGFPPKPSEES